MIIFVHKDQTEYICMKGLNTLNSLMITHVHIFQRLHNFNTLFQIQTMSVWLFYIDYIEVQGEV